MIVLAPAPVSHAEVTNVIQMPPNRTTPRTPDHDQMPSIRIEERPMADGEFITFHRFGDTIHVVWDSRQITQDRLDLFLGLYFRDWATIVAGSRLPAGQPLRTTRLDDGRAIIVVDFDQLSPADLVQLHEKAGAGQRA